MPRHSALRPVRRYTKLALTGSAVMGLLAGVTIAPATAGVSARASGEFVLVADPQERKVFIYSLPGMRLTGTLNDVGLGTAGTGANTGLGSPSHSGTIALPGGRVIGLDDAKDEVIEIRINARGVPSVARRVAVSAPEDGAWSAVDPEHRYFAVSVGKDETTGIVNLVDLRTFTNTAVELPLGAAEELHPYLGGTPLTLFAAAGGVLNAYPVPALLAGRVTATSAVPLNLGGHGQFISPRTKTLGVTTAAGLDVIKLECARPARALARCLYPALGARTTAGWGVGPLLGGQNFRPRLTEDERAVLGAIGVNPAPMDPTRWAETRQDVHVADLAGRVARRFIIGEGIVPRFATSDRHGIFATVHPSGDRLRLFDLRQDSPTYLQFTAVVPLTSMTNGPVAGQPTAGKERRFVAATPNGRYAFVSHGGDGLLTVLDTTRLTTRKITVPSPLRGGGYLLGIDRDEAPADLIGR